MVELHLLSGVALQSLLYFASLSWLAWYFERSKGVDGFHLVIAYAMGALVIENLIGRSIPCIWCVIALGAITAWTVDYFWPRLMVNPSGETTLVMMIAGAAVALLVFDWATAFTPLAAGQGARSIVVVASTVAVSCWIFIIVDAQFRRGRILRLGRSNRWSVFYWARPEPKGKAGYQVTRLMLWFCVLGFPVASTGLLSSTMLKDVALAILMARVVGPRGPMVLFGMAIALSGLRTGAGYAVVSPLSLPLVEATVFVVLLSWLRYRTTRTAWSENVGR
jgi:hypothetical protein